MASTYLTRTNGSAPTNTTKATVSCWVKKSGLAQHQGIFGVRNTGNNNINVQCGFFNGKWYMWYKDGSTDYYLQDSTAQPRDLNGWYHVVFRFDTTQGAAADRLRVYVNGQDLGNSTFSTKSNPTSNDDVIIGTNGLEWSIGRYTFTGGSHNYFDGMISHFYYCDGYSYGPEYFGSTDATTGEWKFGGTGVINFGNNGFYVLKDGNSGTDQSGNGNNLTVGGGTLTKTEDCPSNVFATWNPLWSASNGNVGDVTFTHGNTTTTTSSSYRTTPTTLGMSGSGKYYWEVKRNETGSDTHFGVMSENATPANTATWIGNAANGWILAGDNGQVYTGGSAGSVLANGAVGNGDIFMGAFDCSTGKLYFGVNGTWAGTANPTTGANPHYTLDTSLTYFPVVSTGGDVTANFGNGYFGTTAVSSAGTNASNLGIFEYDVPTGFTALCTKGINSF